jgi:CRISPR/Cas system-associated exonuclease Cas4 (RecB family)
MDETRSLPVSQSSIKSFKRCPQIYYYKKILKIVPKHTALPLYRGVILHTGLEAYYRGEDWEEAIVEEYQEGWDNLLGEEKELYGGDLINDCIKIMAGYCRIYGKKVSKKKEKVLAVELDFTEGSKYGPVQVAPGILLSGRIDLVSEELEGTYKGLWVTEHKSHKKIPTEDTRMYNIQACLYIPVVEKLLGVKVSGIRWNYLRTKVPTIPRVLKNGELSKAAKIDTDYETFMQAIQDNNLNPDDYLEQLENAKSNIFYRRDYTPKDPRMIKMIQRDLQHVIPLMNHMAEHPHRALDPYTCSSCGYKALCQAELLGLDTEFLLKKEYVRKEETSNDDNAIEEDAE